MSEPNAPAPDPHTLQVVVLALYSALAALPEKRRAKALRKARAHLAQIEAQRRPPGGNVVRLREPSQSQTYAIRLAAAAVERLLS